MNEHWIETYKSLITLATEGFKFAALINGGAAVALLAYLGNVAGKGPPDMKVPMLAFLVGLALCGASMGCAYLTQLALLNEERTGAGAQTKGAHQRFLHVAMILFAASLIAFVIGAWSAVDRFR